eukprot:1195615-Prorocentrum_minimum.AAC.1
MDVGGYVVDVRGYIVDVRGQSATDSAECNCRYHAAPPADCYSHHLPVSVTSQSQPPGRVSVVCGSLRRWLPHLKEDRQTEGRRARDATSGAETLLDRYG